MFKKKNYKIYKHTLILDCPSKGKSYIGQTYRDVQQRYGRNGSHYINDSLFWKAIQKYGWSNFKHEILEQNIHSLKQANTREKYWIKVFHTYIDDPLCWGYNLQPGGNSHKMSTYTRQKLSKSLTGRKVSPEVRQKLSAMRLGRKLKLTPKQHKLYSRLAKDKFQRYRNKIKKDPVLWSEYCAKQSRPGVQNGMYGKHHTIESINKMKNKSISKNTRIKMSKIKKGKGLGGDNNNAKPVVQLTIGGEFVCKYASLADVVKQNPKYNYNTLREVTNHRIHNGSLRYQAYGYRWIKESEYKEVPNE